MFTQKYIQCAVRSSNFVFRRNCCETKKVKTAILMLNMGGPECAEQVPCYLHRIMTDTDMIQLPFQSYLGPWIAKRRAPEVAKKYNEIGGGSPILKWTNIQGNLMCKKLDTMSPETAPHKHYVGFRYIDPLTEDTLKEIESDCPEHLVLFSQYPQYSCATSGSSFNSIYRYYKKRPFPCQFKWSMIDRWGNHPLLAKAFAERIKEALSGVDEKARKNYVIIFSAHSLPMKAVNRGDPYPYEVGATVQRVMEELNFEYPYALTWQSKVGPAAWLQPATDVAIKHFAKRGCKEFVLVPIAFVNEHIETLHELDIEYCKDLGKELKLKSILRAAAPNDHPIFIDALSHIVANHLKCDGDNQKFLLRCPSCKNKVCHQSKGWYKKVLSI